MKKSPSNNHLNLEEIARLSGTSRSTVSRVINNHPNVSERTRDRILKVLRETNFQPNPAARALASQHSNVITVVIPHVVSDLFHDPFFPRLLQVLTTEANNRDFSVTLGLTSQEMSEEKFYERIFNNQITDGFIIVSAIFDKTLVKYLNHQGKPFIVIGKPDSDLKKVNFIDVDNIDGAYQIVKYLLAKGRIRIGFIPGRDGLSSAADRQLGYERALQEAGIPFNSAYIGESGMFTEQGGYQSMQGLLSQHLDAVFCASDMTAVGAIRAIKEAGLQIPRDIAVAGFDDNIPFNVSPELTTIRQNIELLGKVAVEEFIAILNSSDNIIHQKILPVDLIIRQSA